MKKTVIAVLVGTIITAGTVWAMPFGPGGGGQRRGGGMGSGLHNPRVIEELGLTDEEVAALQDAQYEHQKEMISLQADLQLARLEQRKLLEADAPDHKAVMKAVETVGTAQTAVQKARVEHMLQIKQVLGPEKSDKLGELRERHQRKRQGKQGPGENRGQRMGGRRGDYRCRGNEEPEEVPPFEMFEEEPGDIAE